MNIRNQLLCAHSTLLFVLFVGIGGLLVAGFLPPPSSGVSAQETADFLRGNLRMRIGVSFMAMGAPLFIGLAVAIGNQLKRIEGEYPALATVQLLAAVVGLIGILLPAYFWLAITFRPETPDTVIAVFSDLGFFLFLAAFAPPMLQNLAIGLCILGDQRTRPIYPRWLGFVNLWLALTFLPGILVPFFRSGPFSFSGLFGFWLVATGFFTWMLLMYAYTVKAIRQQAIS